MMWLVVLVCLTYCFTVGLTAKNKEKIVELKEKNIKDENDFKVEIADLLQENHELTFKIEQYEKDQYYGR